MESGEVGQTTGVIRGDGIGAGRHANGTHCEEWIGMERVRLEVRED